MQIPYGIKGQQQIEQEGRKKFKRREIDPWNFHIILYLQVQE